MAKNKSIKPPAPDLVRLRVDECRSFNWIAAHYGCSTRTVLKWFRSYGLDTTKIATATRKRNKINSIVPLKELMAHRANGLSIGKIGEIYGVHQMTIVAWLKFYGVYSKLPNKKKPPRASLEELQTHQANGLYNRDIGTIYQVHHATVAAWLKFYGITPRLPKKNKPPRVSSQELKAHRANGLSTYKIGEIYGVHYTTVWKWLRFYGISTEFVRGPLSSPLMGMGRKSHPVPPLDELVSHKEDGRGLAWLGKNYGVSTQTVRKWLRLYKISCKSEPGRPKGSGPPRKPPPPFEEIATHYVGDQRSVGWIARHYGLSTSTVIRWLKEYGIHSLGWPEKNRLSVLFLDERRSVAEIAARFKVDERIVVIWLKGIGFDPKGKDSPTERPARMPPPIPPQQPVYRREASESPVWIRGDSIKKTPSPDTRPRHYIRNLPRITKQEFWRQFKEKFPLSRRLDEEIADPKEAIEAERRFCIGGGDREDLAKLNRFDQMVDDGFADEG